MPEPTRDPRETFQNGRPEGWGQGTIEIWNVTSQKLRTVLFGVSSFCRRNRFTFLFLGCCRRTRMSTPGKPQFMSGPRNRWASAAVGSGRPWTSCLSRFMHSLCPEPRPPNYPLIYLKYPQLRAIRTLPTPNSRKYLQSRAIGTLLKGRRDSIQGPLGGPGRGCG